MGSLLAEILPSLLHNFRNFIKWLKIRGSANRPYAARASRAHPPGTTSAIALKTRAPGSLARKGDGQAIYFSGRPPAPGGTTPRQPQRRLAVRIGLPSWAAVIVGGDIARGHGIHVHAMGGPIFIGEGPAVICAIAPLGRGIGEHPQDPPWNGNSTEATLTTFARPRADHWRGPVSAGQHKGPRGSRFTAITRPPILRSRDPPPFGPAVMPALLTRMFDFRAAPSACSRILQRL